LQLREIQPSRDGSVAYYPCRVRLVGGDVRDHVCFVDAADYARIWGTAMERPSLQAVDVEMVEDTPDRLAPAFADELYTAGESGMGYCLFTLSFRDGSLQAYVTGNAVDFLEYPPGKRPADVIRVFPHEGRERPHLHGLFFEWCVVPHLREAVQRPDVQGTRA